MLVIFFETYVVVLSLHSGNVEIKNPIFCETVAFIILCKEYLDPRQWWKLM